MTQLYYCVAYIPPRQRPLKAGGSASLLEYSKEALSMPRALQSLVITRVFAHLPTHSPSTYFELVALFLYWALSTVGWEFWGKWISLCTHPLSL